MKIRIENINLHDEYLEDVKQQEKNIIAKFSGCFDEHQNKRHENIEIHFSGILSQDFFTSNGGKTEPEKVFVKTSFFSSYDLVGENNLIENGNLKFSIVLFRNDMNKDPYDLNWQIECKNIEVKDNQSCC